jgi:hypothetical protein
LSLRESPTRLPSYSTVHTPPPLDSLAYLRLIISLSRLQTTVHGLCCGEIRWLDLPVSRHGICSSLSLLVNNFTQLFKTSLLNTRSRLKLDTTLVSHFKKFVLNHDQGHKVTPEHIAIKSDVLNSTTRIFRQISFVKIVLCKSTTLPSSFSRWLGLKSLAHILREFDEFERLLHKFQSRTLRLAPCGTPYAEQTIWCQMPGCFCEDFWRFELLPLSPDNHKKNATVPNAVKQLDFSKGIIQRTRGSFFLHSVTDRSLL